MNKKLLLILALSAITSSVECFEIWIKTLLGYTYEIEIEATTTIGEIKQMLADKTGLDPSTIRLVFAGKHLEDAYTAQQYNFEKESTMVMTVKK